jgi:hypothetical protein
MMRTARHNDPLETRHAGEDSEEIGIMSPDLASKSGVMNRPMLLA